MKHYLVVLLLLLGSVIVFSESGNKTWFDYFAEAENRLTANPQDDNFQLDPGLAGEWKGLETIMDEYGVLLKYFKFNKDATGYLEIVPILLHTDKTLIAHTERSKKYSFLWGVNVIYTDDNQPVTMIKLYFEDSSSLWYYYAKYSSNGACFFPYDEKTNSTGKPMNLNTKKFFDTDWANNSYKLLNALWEAYQNKKAMDERSVTNYMTNSMLYQGLRMSAGSWF
ncbi:MAG: hypothetical protein JXJ04_14675 [Spirochaetales bacterium]|nr:hypothetical protein [Spirochaetales bacterium]